MNVSSISEAMQPTLMGHLKRACKQISFLEMPTREVGLKNPYMICDYCRGSHEADECEENNPSEQVCLSGGDICNDPSLLRFYQNDDTSPWGTTNIRRRERMAPNGLLEGAKDLKDLLSHKEKLEKAVSSVKLSEECSAIIQKSLPQKEGDPGSFTLPFFFIGPLAVKNAMADLGASINLMPHSLF
ncbi:hypothetical protein Tco_1092414 [Tanacetum coccineum]|uniref:Uncharacterized protein n=1 Tax=Tanacetum coccineum TaxID=301880 RepID=A0ABQ5IB03_9ASTR